jgi:hypothetical protein
MARDQEQEFDEHKTSLLTPASIGLTDDDGSPSSRSRTAPVAAGRTILPATRRRTTFPKATTATTTVVGMGTEATCRRRWMCRIRQNLVLSRRPSGVRRPKPSW